MYIYIYDFWNAISSIFHVFADPAPTYQGLSSGEIGAQSGRDVSLEAGRDTILV